MIREITLRQVGGSIGATIPKDIAERHNLDVGDTMFVVDTPEGILLTPYDPATRAALEAYVRVARENREAMAALSRL
jgi:putative addiction module antidote